MTVQCITVTPCQPIRARQEIPPFRGRTSLKKLWLSGKLPSVKVGLYSEPLTKDSISREHLLPKSLGGKSVESNIALANKKLNNIRGNRPLSLFLTKEMLDRYLAQFKDVVVGCFCGNCYSRSIRRTVRRIFRKEKENAYKVI